MTRKTATERKRDERTRMRKRGYTLRQFWIHPEDWPRATKYLGRLMLDRERGKAEQ